MEKSAYATTIKYLASFGVIMINLILRVILRKLTYFERLKSLSKQQKRIMLKVLFAMFINTALLTLIINISFPLFPTKNDLFLRGNYSDFTRDWYIKVGSIFTIMMFISIFSPHFIFICLFYPIGALKRRCC